MKIKTITKHNTNNASSSSRNNTCWTSMNNMRRNTTYIFTWCKVVVTTVISHFVSVIDIWLCFGVHWHRDSQTYVCARWGTVDVRGIRSRRWNGDFPESFRGMCSSFLC